MTATPDTSVRSRLGDAVLDAAQLGELFTEARSNTVFADRPVPVDLVREAYDLAKWGPSSNNNGPLRVVAAASDAARSAVLAAATEGNRAKLDRAPLLLVVAGDERYHDYLDVTAPQATHLYDGLEQAPERRARAAHQGALLQAGYLILALRALGLELRPYGGFDKAALRESLLGDRPWAPEMLLAVGYPPEGDHGAGERKGRVGSDVAVSEL